MISANQSSDGGYAQLMVDLVQHWDLENFAQAAASLAYTKSFRQSGRFECAEGRMQQDGATLSDKLAGSDRDSACP